MRALFFLLFIFFDISFSETFVYKMCESTRVESTQACVHDRMEFVDSDIYIIKDTDAYFAIFGAFDNQDELVGYLRELPLSIRQNLSQIELDCKALEFVGNEHPICRLKPEQSGAEDFKKVKESEQQQRKQEILKESSFKPLDLTLYENISIEVDSKNNIMYLYGYRAGESDIIRSYVVSTGKYDSMRPKGQGSITDISLNPYWYPTESIKSSFAKKGIELPDIVPPNHRLNYMGSAKLNLTHTVNGSGAYRIHGTLNEKTLGKNVSAGCIRMKNSEVKELAKALQKIDLSRVIVDLY